MRERARARVGSGAVVSLLAAAACAAVVDLQPVAYAESDAASPPGVPADSGGDAAPVQKPEADADASACGVHADGKLYCTNRPGSALRAEPKASAAVVNTLRTSSSYFLCWGAGERHAGGNTTWYYTIGDDNPSLGWIPAVLLSTPDAFDANPTAYGLRNCSQ